MLSAIAFLSLRGGQSNFTQYRHRADLGYSGLNRGFEQLRRRARVPLAIIRKKFNLGKVTKNAGHGYGTTAPWLAE